MAQCDGTAPAGRQPGWDQLDPVIAAVAHGDRDAFELVYERLSGPVYGAILAVLRDPAQAEEVAQEVFLEMWRRAFRYDPGKGSATRWALTIARHRAIDRVRSAAAASARELRIAAGAPGRVSDTAADTRDLELLRPCLRDLSQLQREAIMLAFYGEHTYAEAARMLGVPLGTLKNRIRDGLARLRDCMQGGPAARGPEAGARQLQETLRSRALFEQARGILAERLRVTPDDASVLLRRNARAHHRCLAQLAGDIAREAAVAGHGAAAPPAPGRGGSDRAVPAAAPGTARWRPAPSPTDPPRGRVPDSPARSASPGPGGNTDVRQELRE
jgi:RNA polymerase sigma-70 factor (ECF subfamily)